MAARPGDFVFSENNGGKRTPVDPVDEILRQGGETFEGADLEWEGPVVGMPVGEVYNVFGVQ